MTFAKEVAYIPVIEGCVGNRGDMRVHRNVLSGVLETWQRQEQPAEPLPGSGCVR